MSARWLMPSDIYAHLKALSVSPQEYVRILSKHGVALTVAQMKVCDEVGLSWGEYAASYARTFGRQFGKAPNIGADIMSEADTW